MSQITAIQPQVKNPQRYNIFLDDKFAFGIDEDTLIQLSIKKGQEVDEKQLAKFLQKSEQGKLYQKVLRFLELRLRSEKEVKDYLWRKINVGKPRRFLEDRPEAQTTDEQIQPVLDRLKQHNYLNDLEFARWWIEQRSLSSKPRGDRLIRLELRQKGISEEVIKEVLEAAKVESANQDGEDETPLQKLIKKQWLKYKSLPLFEAKNKLIRYLLSRGFDYQEIKATLSKDELSS